VIRVVLVLSKCCFQAAASHRFSSLACRVVGPMAGRMLSLFQQMTTRWRFSSLSFLCRVTSGVSWPTVCSYT